MVLEAKKGIMLDDSDGVQIDNMKMIYQFGAVLTMYNSDNIRVDNFSYQIQNEKPSIRILGNSSSDIWLDEKSVSSSDVENWKKHKKRCG